MPAATSDQEPEPLLSSTFTACSVASVLTPTTPSLSSSASAMPAQWVPWSLSSDHDSLQLGPRQPTNARPAPTFASRSGWSSSMPVSMMAMSAPPSPSSLSPPVSPLSWTTSASTRSTPQGSVWAMAWYRPSASTYRTSGRRARRSSAGSANRPATACPMSPKSSTRRTESAAATAASAAARELVPTMWRPGASAAAPPIPTVSAPAPTPQRNVRRDTVSIRTVARYLHPGISLLVSYRRAASEIIRRSPATPTHRVSGRWVTGTRARSTANEASRRPDGGATGAGARAAARRSIRATGARRLVIAGRRPSPPRRPAA